MFKTAAGYVALGLDAGTVVLVAIGATKALYSMLSVFLRRQITPGIRRETWGQFGIWLLLGLEFALAADIVLTAISPSWNEIGKLAAIAGIRTFLSYFLEKDMDKYAEMDRPDGGAPVNRAA